MTASDDRTARAALSLLTPADPQVASLTSQAGAAPVLEWLRGGLLDATPGAFERRLAAVDPVERLDRAHDLGIRFVTPADDEWPTRLNESWNPEDPTYTGTPVGLWVRGTDRLDDVTRDSVAVVGSRSATPYGTATAGDLAAGLAQRGRAAVAGAAFGVDAAAHAGALAADGRTVAVLPGGVDVTYPRAHDRLLGAIADNGALVSEFPPGSTPSRSQFLARNRLCATLSGATVVVEAVPRSGALDMARWAARVGRPLMAVPGPITSATSRGPNDLIATGQATLIASADDIVRHLNDAPGHSNPVADVDQSYTPKPDRQVGAPAILTPPGAPAPRR